ncbi:unnamed protein product [Symbiodinium natans]|uniref:Uncharacterized protein n=1 Tax=Symbiodinium natans TaxID=878477 RepID=A0A812J4D1_9DINO|nr:unnamed protein product [Symbiodinium natans]
MEDAHDAVSATAGPAPAATGEEKSKVDDRGEDPIQQVKAAIAEMECGILRRLEYLENQVLLLSSELAKCRELVSPTDQPVEDRFDSMREACEALQASMGTLDHKLEDSMRQLKEQVRQARMSKVLINSWCRQAATKIADCEEAVSKIASGKEEDVVLNAVMGRIGQEKTDREADVQLIKRELQELRAACSLRRVASTRSPGRRNASPKNRPLCRRQGWFTASLRSLNSPAARQNQQDLSTSIDFASPPKNVRDLDPSNVQDLVQQVSQQMQPRVSHAEAWRVDLLD